MSHIFISYSKKNREYARALADRLLDEGFDIWIDDRIDYGENWERTIFRAIDDCAAFIVIMTPQSYDSLWVQRECHYAEKRGKPPFPILQDGEEEFPRYGLTQYVDVRGGYLPPADFFDRIAQYAPRRPVRGAEVIMEPDTRSVLHEDITDTTETEAVQAEVVRRLPASEDPPLSPRLSMPPTGIESTPPPATTKPQPQSRQIAYLVAGVVTLLVIVVGVVGAVYLSGRDNGGDPGADSDLPTLDQTMSASDYLEQGQLLDEAGDKEGAIEQFSQAIRLDDTYWNAYSHRGFVYHDLGDYERAVEDLSRSIELGTDNAYTYALRGSIYYDWGMTDNALPDLEQAVSIGIDDAYTYQLYGQILLANGDWESAAETFQEAIDLYPDDPSFYRDLGDAYYEGEHHDQALEYYEAYQKMAGYDADPTINSRIEELRSQT